MNELSSILNEPINRPASLDPGEYELLIGRAPARSLWAVAGRARSPLTHDVADGPSADVPFGSDFVKVPILRDMELGQTG